MTQREITVKEASRRLEIPAHTIRFWEQEFPHDLQPHRTPGGQRRYGEEQLEVLGRIAGLRRTGLGIPEIRRRLAAATVRPDLEEALDSLSRRIAQAVRGELEGFLVRCAEQEGDGGDGE